MNLSDALANITLYHPRGLDLLGFIPQFVTPDDPRSAKEQFNQSYAHGGGWQPMSRWEMRFNSSGIPLIKYPGDPAYSPVAKLQLRDESIYVYPHSWVMILQLDGSFEVARMD